MRGIHVVNIATAGRRGKQWRSAPSTLNAMRLDRLHVVGPGTDLEIGLMPKSQFTGGSAVSAKGITFKFAGWEVKSFSADRGREAIESFLGIAAEARRMGEVALVDPDSPVYRSGRTFHSILFDENAACHFALV